MRRSLWFATCVLALVACSSPDGSESDLQGDESAAALPEGKADGVDATHRAPAWLLSTLGTGTWQDPKYADTTRGWVDIKVRNRRMEKRVWVEVAAPYEGGAIMRTLHPAWFKGDMGNGYERWGMDTVEIFPTGGPKGAHLEGPVVYRLRMQEDPDNDGKDQVVVSGWSRLFGEGVLQEPASDPWSPGRTSPVVPVDEPSPPEVHYAPFDDTGLLVVREIDRVREAKRSEPARRHTIHAAIFNINDKRIVDKLIAAHKENVDVRLITDATKLRPSAYWQTEDDRLLLAGVPLLGVRHAGRGAMHDKIAIFDGSRMATGSANWEPGTSSENHENMLLTDEPDLVQAYAQRFELISGEVKGPRRGASDPAAPRSVSFAPDEQPYRIAGNLIDGAKQSIELAMFTCKDVPYKENGKDTSLFQKLVAAVNRGVQVTLITDYGIAEAAEYYGVMSEDDPMDEWLEDRGVHVVRADNTFGKYASMHHKFAVIDAKVVLTGAFNWYWDAAYLNDEDQLLWRDEKLAASYTGEFTDLLRRYDEAYNGSLRPQVNLRFVVEHSGTSYGDRVVVVGDLPELGAWDVKKGLALDGTGFPTWTGALTLPAGVRMQLKWAVVRANGSVSWQPGSNRARQVPTGVEEADIVVSDP